MDAHQVPKLREERKDFKDYDPRWTAALKVGGRALRGVWWCDGVVVWIGAKDSVCGHRLRGFGGLVARLCV